MKPTKYYFLIIASMITAIIFTVIITHFTGRSYKFTSNNSQVITILFSICVLSFLVMHDIFLRFAKYFGHLIEFNYLPIRAGIDGGDGELLSFSIKIFVELAFIALLVLVLLII